MDMSLLKPLSVILNVNVIDILSGEKVSASEMQNKYEETLESIIKRNLALSKSFGVYGMLLIYIILIVYKTLNDICYYDIVSILLGFITFKFLYKYKLEKNKFDIIISFISLISCIFLLVEYISVTI